MWTRSYSARENRNVTQRGQVIRSRPGQRTTHWTKEKINEAIALARHNGWLTTMGDWSFTFQGIQMAGRPLEWDLTVSSTGVQGTTLMWNPESFTSVQWSMISSEEVYFYVTSSDSLATLVAATTDWIGVGVWQREQRADELDFFLPYRDREQETTDLVVKWNNLSQYGEQEGGVWRIQGDTKSGSTLISRVMLDLGYITAASIETSNNVQMFWFEKATTIGGALSRYFNM